MKYLSPEIEAFYKKHETTKSLAKINVSCGIFQDCNPKEERATLHQKKK